MSTSHPLSGASSPTAQPGVTEEPHGYLHPSWTPKQEYETIMDRPNRPKALKPVKRLQVISLDNIPYITSPVNLALSPHCQPDITQPEPSPPTSIHIVIPEVVIVKEEIKQDKTTFRLKLYSWLTAIGSLTLALLGILYAAVVFTFEVGTTQVPSITEKSWTVTNFVMRYSACLFALLLGIIGLLGTLSKASTALKVRLNLLYIFGLFVLGAYIIALDALDVSIGIAAANEEIPNQLILTINILYFLFIISSIGSCVFCSCNTVQQHLGPKQQTTGNRCK
ncbi:fslG [Acrasis kona]|uniref:FslG n=1 Tax=Acrasis kona TaxID=1008807 RepID=A0AAW2ZN23_9EUKA